MLIFLSSVFYAAIRMCILVLKNLQKNIKKFVLCTGSMFCCFWSWRWAFCMSQRSWREWSGAHKLHTGHQKLIGCQESQASCCSQWAEGIVHITTVHILMIVPTRAVMHNTTFRGPGTTKNQLWTTSTRSTCITELEHTSLLPYILLRLYQLEYFFVHYYLTVC